jgi:hypothetical protein
MQSDQACKAVFAGDSPLDAALELQERAEAGGGEDAQTLAA